MASYRCSIWIPIEAGDYAVEIVYRIENTGIGWYEYWGTRYYDEGENYAVVESMTVLFSEDDDPDVRSNVLKYVKDHYDDLAQTCADLITASLAENDGD